MDDWMTSKEVADAMGLRRTWSAVKVCRNHGLEENSRKNPNGGPYPMVLFRREAVEGLLEERQLRESMEAQGHKRCAACKEWKDRRREFWNKYSECKECARETQRKRQATPRKPQAKEGYPKGFPRTLVLNPASSYVLEGSPPTPDDSLRYACMDRGYAMRPIPRGMTKREAFCATCEASYCGLRPELTPAEVRKLPARGARVPESIPIPKTIASSRGRVLR